METEEKVEDFLAHFGVKGMKWGQRKDRSNHGLSARARRADAVAERRPTRGNVRTAERSNRALQKNIRDKENFNKLKGKSKEVFKQAEKGDFKSRSKTQKAALVAAGLTGLFGTNKAVTAVMGTKMPVVQLALVATGGVMGARAARHVIDQRASVKVSDLSGS